MKPYEQLPPWLSAIMLLGALISWLICAVSLLQARREIDPDFRLASRAQATAAAAQGKRYGWSVLLVVPEAFTPRGRVCQKRAQIAAVCFVVIIVILAVSPCF